MFCDMVGSSGLSTRLDPEMQREVVSAFQAYCAGEINRLGGMVAQYLGDGVLAYFGYPAAHEDDAERAVRTGLSILAGIGDLKAAPGVTLQARIGVATGIVVVGDLIREGVMQENAAIGETTNLAARLQSIAETDTVLICPVTHRLVGVLFEYRDLGVHTLKCFTSPVAVRQVMGASNVVNRFQARRADVAAPLLGRDEELELLLRRWRDASRGEGRVVLLTGEPGIGKSRLVHALQDRLRSELYTQLNYFCSPYQTDTALYPISAQLLRAAGIESNDSVGARLDKLESLLAPSSEDVARDIALFAAPLSIPGGERYPLPSLAPRHMKRANPERVDPSAQVLVLCPAGADGFRRLALDRSDIAGGLVPTGRGGTQPEVTVVGDGTTGVHAALAQPQAHVHHGAYPFGPFGSRNPYCRSDTRQGATRDSPRTDYQPHRWRAALHRRVD